MATDRPDERPDTPPPDNGTPDPRTPPRPAYPPRPTRPPDSATGSAPRIPPKPTEPPPGPGARAPAEPAFDPAVDWPALTTMGCGIVAVAMMFPAWSISRVGRAEAAENGFNRDILPAAPILLVILLLAVIATAGYTLVARRPALLPLAAFPAFAALMVVIVTTSTLSKIGGDVLGQIPGGSYEVGAGAWVCLAFTVLALCASLVPLADTLRRAAPNGPRQPPAPPGTDDG